MCYRLDEDASHTLFKCKFAKEVWRELQLEQVRIDLAELYSPKEVFLYIWRCENKLQVQLVTTLWALYNERNAINAGERQKTPTRLSLEIQMNYFEYLEVFSKTPSVPVSVRSRWAKPAAGFLKINVDASFREDSKIGGWDFVVHDDHGEAVAAGAGHIKNVSSPFHAEAIACLQALNFACGQGMMSLELETDFQNLRNALQTNDWDSGPEGVLLK